MHKNLYSYSFPLVSSEVEKYAIWLIVIWAVWTRLYHNDVQCSLISLLVSSLTKIQKAILLIVCRDLRSAVHCYFQPPIRRSATRLCGNRPRHFDFRPPIINKQILIHLLWIMRWKYFFQAKSIKFTHSCVHSKHIVIFVVVVHS